MFLCAKSASAATAALGLAGYLQSNLGVAWLTWTIPIAVGAVAVLTLLVNCGIHRTSQVNLAIVGVTIGSLLFFIAMALPTALSTGTKNVFPFFEPAEGHSPAGGFLEACALMFVAFTGYGRIATLGEEILDPIKNIPRAIIATLIFSTLLYVGVGLGLIGTLGAAQLASETQRVGAPLASAATYLGSPALRHVVSIGAVTAMLGVLLNLIIGLSRVVLAMGRRGDFPKIVSKIEPTRSNPYVAVLLVGTVVALIALVGSVRLTWSFSAFTVLIYYAITNLAAVQLKADERLYPPAFAWMGLLGCLFLAFWFDVSVWLTGLAVLVAGFAWRWAWRWHLSRLSKDSVQK